jgi:hypothetical protein
MKTSWLQQNHICFRSNETWKLRSSEKFLGAGKGVSASAGAGADEPLKQELSMEPARKYHDLII